MTQLSPGVPTGPGEAVALPEPLVPPSGRPTLVLRVILAVGLVLALAQMLAEPVERPLQDLLDGLRAGDVETVTIARPAPGVEAFGTWPVEWTGDGLPGRASYEISDDGGPASVDEGRLILDAAERSPAPVDVSVRLDFIQAGTTWHLGGFALVAALGWLVLGPQPRLATKWAWFWLAGAAPLLWLAFVVLEPVPLWRRAPAAAGPRRLTGGWAFLLSVTLVPFVGGTLMDLVERVL
ncbi:hypothetical protein KZX45_13035 [Georgenia sp. EYE_87]|uniref:hypothetical protein n=1 Tax=Georgenia sp. EYE_87 TaxID=2853448 RepID=UPI0020050029|nr:hypothetical protein [Georgenia sp. EYE_87]MCK6211468.1 hypothetical protein [Georgenia sp. EYE_87]